MCEREQDDEMKVASGRKSLAAERSKQKLERAAAKISKQKEQIGGAKKKLDKVKEDLKSKATELKAKSSELKKEKAAFKVWRSRHKTDGLVSKYTKALEMKDPSERQQKIDECFQVIYVSNPSDCSFLEHHHMWVHTCKFVKMHSIVVTRSGKKTIHKRLVARVSFTVRRALPRTALQNRI